MLNSDSGWIENPVGSGTFELFIGDLAAGNGGVAMFAVSVDVGLPQGVAEIDNTTMIADDGNNGADPDPANNSDQVSTRVLRVENISKRDLLTTTATGAYQGWLPLNSLPNPANNLPEQERQAAEASGSTSKPLANFAETPLAENHRLSRFARWGSFLK
jgi:hypothetical protein